MPQWLGGPEILILLVIVLLLFGGRKLPELARGTGRALRIFKSEVKELDPKDTASDDVIDGKAETLTADTTNADDGDADTQAPKQESA